MHAIVVPFARSVVVAALLVAGCTDATPVEPEAAPPTSGERIATKTYSSPYGLSLNYPAAWAVVEANDSRTVRFLAPAENVPIARERSPGSFGIEVYENPARLSAKDWLDQHGWPFGADRAVTATSIAGKEAIDVTTGKMFAPNRYLYVGTDALMLRISPIAAESAAILESLRFTK